MNGSGFIGKGLKFPIKVNPRGGLSSSEGPERIQDAIWLIVKTGLGERLMRPQFGSGVDSFVFQPNSAVTRAADENAASSANRPARWRASNSSIAAGRARSGAAQEEL